MGLLNQFEKVKDKFKYLDPKKEFGGKLEVHEINEEAEDLRDALGITRDRCKELQDSCIDAYESSNNSAEAGAKISKSCRHPNELFFCAQVLAELVIKERMHEAKDKLLNALRNGGLGGLKGFKDFPGMDDD